MFVQAVEIINVNLSRDCDRFLKKLIESLKGCHRAWVRFIFLPWKWRVGWKEWNEFLVFVATWPHRQLCSLCWNAACIVGHEPARDATGPQPWVAAQGACGLPAAQWQQVKRDWVSVLTGLTQFIWKFWGENTSNKDKNSDSKEQMRISVRDKTEF